MIVGGFQVLTTLADRVGDNGGSGGGERGWGGGGGGRGAGVKGGERDYGMVPGTGFRIFHEVMNKTFEHGEKVVSKAEK